MRELNGQWRTAPVGVVFEEDDDLCVVDFVGGEDAVFVVGPEEDDRRHEGAGEVQACFRARERSCRI
ncbi:hypothetical protein [Hoeflea sp.]|uniref:hypothetical protein n=1 Tax=Hoeflea sp. TaxID=1940281 RepID=UPI003B0288A4